MFVEEYQITDTEGRPVGPPQKFEAETEAELRTKIKAAHINAAAKLYETKKRVKLEDLMQPDPDQPLKSFERKQISADDRVRIAKALNDPSRSLEAVEEVLESLGIPVSNMRDLLTRDQLETAKKKVSAEIYTFRGNRPDYHPTEHNRDILQKWLEKKNYSVTAKNLDIAYEACEEYLDKKPPIQVPATTPAPPAIPAAPEPVAPVPPVEAAIPQPPTPAAPISASPATVQPRASSSGLGRSDSSATPTPATPKAKGITRQDIARMSSQQYREALRDPEFAKQVDALNKG